MLKGIMLATFFAMSMSAKTGVPCEGIVGHVDDAKGNGTVMYMTDHEVDPDFNYIRYHGEKETEGCFVVSVVSYEDNGEDVADRWDVSVWK